MRTFLFITFFLLLRFICFAQQYNYVNYDKKDGLAGSVVYHMVQDRDGFIWFGTETGLSRFDGTQFKTYTVKDGLPDNEIIRLFVDSKNRVWIMPFSTSICYYQNGSIHNKNNDSLVRRITLTGFVRYMMENDKGELAIVQDNRISIIQPSGKVKEFDKYDGNTFQIAAGAGLGNDNEFLCAMLFGGFASVFRVDEDSLHLLKRTNLIMTGTYPIYFYKDLAIFVNKENLTGKSNRGSFQFSIHGFLRTERLNDSLLVICWSSRVEIFNIYRQKTERIIYTGKNVSNFLEDIEGNWWFSSLGSGIYRLQSTQVKNYFIQEDRNIYPVSALEKFGDTLYVGTDQYRIHKINLVNHAMTYDMIGNGPSPGRTVTLNRMPNGVMMAGTETGLYALVPGGKIIKVPSSAIKSTQAYGDYLLFGASWATLVFDTKEMRTVDSLQSARNTAVCKHGDNIYIGKLSGLYMYDKNKQPHYLGDLHPSLASKISAIRAMDNGIIWVGTYGFGIIGLLNNKVVATINADSGLSSNICRTLFVNNDILWVGTDQGLNKVQFDGKKYVLESYTVSDGLASDIINTILQVGKTVYVGTPAGVSFFEDEKMIPRSICRLMITGIQTPKQNFHSNISGLSFGHYENDIRIEFSGISFKSGKEILYRYKLNGLDDTWRQTKDNFLNFLSLPSGDYDLEIMASNKFGVQSETVHLRFSIAKLIWEENWFRISTAALLVLIVWLFIWYRTQKIRQEAAFKIETNRKMSELEQMALKSQMNPHFIFNSLQSIQQFVIDKDVAGANKYISDFAKLIRFTLDISSQTNISLADEINYITTYLELEKAKFEGKFNYLVRAGNIDINSLFIPALLLQPYVENSIRHGIYYLTGNAGMIHIDFSINDEYLVCIIEDNGVGREASAKFKTGKQKYESKGLSLTARRIDMLNQQYAMPIFSTIEDVYTGGTRVSLRFPLQEAKKQA